MSAIADLFGLLASHFNSLTPAAQWILWFIGIYSLSFLAIRFVIFIYRKWKSDGLSHAPATALAMLLATFLWPAFFAIWGALFYPWDGAGLLERIQAVLVVWLIVAVVVGPLSSASSIYIFIAATMFIQCLYMAYADLDFDAS